MVGTISDREKLPSHFLAEYKAPENVEYLFLENNIKKKK